MRAVLSEQGEKCAFIGKIGIDQFGTFLFDTLVELGFDCRALVFDQIHNTISAFVSISKSGDRFYRGHGADCFLDEKEISAEIIANSRQDILNINL